MGTLRIYLLGGIRIRRDRWPDEFNLCRTARGLLAYLVLFRERIHPREVLAGIFWGDASEDRARSCLSTALWRLRKALEPLSVPRGTYLVTTPTGEVGFNRQSNHWLDVAVLEDQSKQILAQAFQTLTAEAAFNLENALTLYKGELLEGFYDDWALRERERLRSLYLESQAHLMRYYSHHEVYDHSLTCGHNILSLDPLREEIHREMMRLYYRSGNRPLALRQYEICRQILQSELGVAPMKETQILYTQIFEKATHDHVQSLAQGDLNSARQALKQLQQTVHDFEKSTEQLRRSTKFLEQFIVSKESADTR